MIRPDFVQRYAKLTNDELQFLGYDRDRLTPDALKALEAEFARRGFAFTEPPPSSARAYAGPGGIVVRGKTIRIPPLCTGCLTSRSLTEVSVVCPKQSYRFFVVMWQIVTYSYKFKFCSACAASQLCGSGLVQIGRPRDGKANVFKFENRAYEEMFLNANL